MRRGITKTLTPGDWFGLRFGCLKESRWFLNLKRSLDFSLNSFRRDFVLFSSQFDLPRLNIDFVADCFGRFQSDSLYSVHLTCFNFFKSISIITLTRFHLHRLERCFRLSQVWRVLFIPTSLASISTLNPKRVMQSISKGDCKSQKSFIVIHFPLPIPTQSHPPHLTFYPKSPLVIHFPPMI